ncbi:hypothetical protein FHW68_005520 [Pseudomonas sp. Tn43]|nr:hypothetical protein [Pseudomonas sp. Tn43]
MDARNKTVDGFYAGQRRGQAIGVTSGTRHADFLNKLRSFLYVAATKSDFAPEPASIDITWPLFF